MIVKSIVICLLIQVVVVSATIINTTDANKICYVMLRSRLYKESNNIHHRVITTNTGEVVKALTIYDMDTDIPMVTVVGNDLDKIISDMSGLDSDGNNRTFNPTIDYCEYSRKMKLRQQSDLDEQGQLIIENYNRIHRHT
ncbi:hypothetical protein DFJ63DRAFT_311593 [Scheffersomyces coipomensis]|uniref:uncharacterized protein n=1 Tax=Scheffersomyces coipomensis TaxID=1788519 RepID=UPI00315C8B08